jgi:hypothetical protein
MTLLRRIVSISYVLLQLFVLTGIPNLNNNVNASQQSDDARLTSIYSRELPGIYLRTRCWAASQRISTGSCLQAVDFKNSSYSELASSL